MNPLDILKAIKNPQQYVMNEIANQNNPILNNMIKLAQEGKNQEVEQIARNIMKSKGIDYDKEILPMLENFK